MERVGQFQKLIDEVVTKTNNKVILIDATGEYCTLTSNSLILGTDTYFPYQKLSILDLFFSTKTNWWQSQSPVLLEAIRSLKMVRIAKKNKNCSSNTKQKADKVKADYIKFYQTNINEIEDNNCNFDILHLIDQIKEECIYHTGFTDKQQDPKKWGGYDAKTYDYQTSLIGRISDLINTGIFKKLLGFQEVSPDCNSIVDVIEKFINQNNEQILRISFEYIPSSFSVKEIIANALASYLLKLARFKKFETDPLILVVDEAHQFLNKNIKDEFFESQTLDFL